MGRSGGHRSRTGLNPVRLMGPGLTGDRGACRVPRISRGSRWTPVPDHPADTSPSRRPCPGTLRSSRPVRSWLPGHRRVRLPATPVSPFRHHAERQRRSRENMRTAAVMVGQLATDMTTQRHAEQDDLYAAPITPKIPFPLCRRGLSCQYGPSRLSAKTLILSRGELLWLVWRRAAASALSNDIPRNRHAGGVLIT